MPISVSFAVRSVGVPVQRVAANAVGQQERRRILRAGQSWRGRYPKLARRCDDEGFDLIPERAKGRLRLGDGVR